MLMIYEGDALSIIKDIHKFEYTCSWNDVINEDVTTLFRDKASWGRIQ